jgi:DNA-binding response OmpR family regulator
MKMQTKPNILLITHRTGQLYDQVLKANGYKVDLAESLETAERLWQPGKYRLLLVEPNGNIGEALHFCNETKKTDPTQRFAFMGQRPLEIPRNSCADDIIMLEYNPELFVERVTELVS